MTESNKNLVNLLKKFPDQNPNPIIRISDKGILEYYNQPSKSIINFFNLKINKKVKKGFFDHIKPALSRRVHTFELRIASLSYSFKCVYIEE